MYPLFFLALFIWTTNAHINASDYEPFYCRMRISNITNTTLIDEVQDQYFDIRFEFAPRQGPISKGSWSRGWLGHIPTDDNRGIEVLYKVILLDGNEITGVSYPASSGLQSLAPDQITFKCSKVVYDNSTRTVKFPNSYVTALSDPVKEGQRVFRKIALKEQQYVDCYLKNGYEHPYTLDDIHRYVADGERFTKGCSALLGCGNGLTGGVSRCPPTFPQPNVTYHVKNVGECCDASVTIDDVEKKGCPKDERGSAFEEPIGKAYVSWHVKVVRKDETQPCGGVIIEKNWFLTTKSCLDRNPQDYQFELPLSVKYQPTKFRNVSITDVKSISANLVLAKIDLPFVENDWTTAIQKVNLFWTQDACKKFTNVGCHLILATDQENDQSPSTVVSSVSKVEKDFVKIDKLQTAVFNGTGAVGWYEKANFLIGIYANGDLIDVCPYLDAIRNGIKEK